MNEYCSAKRMTQVFILVLPKPHEAERKLEPELTEQLVWGGISARSASPWDPGFVEKRERETAISLPLLLLLPSFVSPPQQLTSPPANLCASIRSRAALTPVRRVYRRRAMRANDLQPSG